jgi:hypothetical protein
MTIQRMDHVGIVVDDLAAATAAGMQRRADEGARDASRSVAT